MPVLNERKKSRLRRGATVFDNLAAVPKHSRKSRDADTDSRADKIRALPPIDECLRAAEALPALAGLSRSYLKVAVQRAQAELRAAILSGRGQQTRDRDAMIDAVVRAAARAVATDEPVLRPVVNATGVVLHTNLGRAILAESAIEAVEMAARSAVNLEYDLETGGRGDRDSIVEDEICALTGAEAATVVNNNAAAVVLALNSLAEGREVIVSRGEMIEIGGSFRLPDVMAKSGAILREVGTTNRTHPSDYADAIGPDTALLLKVHPSNYRVVGFTSEVTLEDLVEIGRARGVDVMEDLGAGALIDLTEYGIPREPIVRDRIAAGAAIVTFSGDKLLGGPQAGLIVGRRAAIDRIKRNPLKRALRCDKLTLAALSATMRLYLRSGDLAHELPTLRILSRRASEIRAIAPRAREIVAERLGDAYVVEIVDVASQVGSGAMPVEELKSVALRVTHPEKSANAIAAMFRRARIIGRVTDDSFHLDLRTIEDPAVFSVKLETD
jgi:L-seryl-tRNA(Ser) seleniumtransferase